MKKKLMKCVAGILAGTMLFSTTVFAKEEIEYYGFAEDEVIIANTDVTWYTMPVGSTPANIGIRVTGVTNKGNLVVEGWDSDVFTGEVTHKYVVTTPAELTPVFNTVYGTQIDQATAYERLIALKEVYPEGMTWNESNVYDWTLADHSSSRHGYACSAYAMQVSDLVFGVSAPIYYHSDVNNIKVGDILHLGGINHDVVALEVYDDYVIMTEGNYNGTIHWGWKVSKANLIKWNVGITTRY